MFNLSEVWGLRPDGSNPCRHVPKYREMKRERFLSSAELRRLGATLAQVEADGSESRFVVAAFRLLILTGCRLGEIQTLRWEYITAKGMELPDTKTGARRIPLPEAARAVLDALESTDGNPYVVEGETYRITRNRPPAPLEALFAPKLVLMVFAFMIYDTLTRRMPCLVACQFRWSGNCSGTVSCKQPCVTHI